MTHLVACVIIFFFLRIGVCKYLEHHKKLLFLKLNLYRYKPDLFIIFLFTNKSIIKIHKKYKVIIRINTQTIKSNKKNVS
jgi:hypothetical protein